MAKVIAIANQKGGTGKTTITYTLGLTTGKTIFGREIRCYDMERTICDILRSRNQMDVAIVTDAIKKYSRRKNKNLPLLMRYAERFGVANLIRRYMEVLL